MATVREMMAAGAARLIRNLAAAKWRRHDMVRRLQHDFPDTTWQSAEAVVDRGLNAAAGGNLLNNPARTERLRANEIRAADRGCTHWRYYTVVDISSQGSPGARTRSIEVNNDRSMTPAEIRQAALAVADAMRARSKDRDEYNEVPSDSVFGDVHILTAERACP